MSVYDENWPRWVQASVADHFKAAAAALSPPIPTLVEGIDERTTTFIEANERIEIRVNGPSIVEQSHRYWHLEVDVNILIFSYMGGALPNVYSGTQITGNMAKVANDPIPIYKYGTGVSDDQSLIGCLTLRRGKEESVKVFHFGEIDREHRLREFAVDVNLEMDIYP